MEKSRVSDHQEAVNITWASVRSKRQLLCEEADARA